MAYLNFLEKDVYKDYDYYNYGTNYNMYGANIGSYLIELSTFNSCSDQYRKRSGNSAT